MCMCICVCVHMTVWESIVTCASSVFVWRICMYLGICIYYICVCMYPHDMWEYVFMHVSMWVSVFLCLYMCGSVCEHSWMCECVCICLSLCGCVRLYIHVCSWVICICLGECMCACVHECMFMCISYSYVSMCVSLHLCMCWGFARSPNLEDASRFLGRVTDKRETLFAGLWAYRSQRQKRVNCVWVSHRLWLWPGDLANKEWQLEDDWALKDK